MAESLRLAVKRTMRGAVSMVLVCIGITAAAQALVDPTKPPAHSGKDTGNIDATSPSGPVLQSILISSKRAEAIVSGKTVRVGDKVGDATVVKISENEVVLKHGKELQRLTPFPNIEMRPSAGKTGKNTDNRR